MLPSQYPNQSIDLATAYETRKYLDLSKGDVFNASWYERDDCRPFFALTRLRPCGGLPVLYYALLRLLSYTSNCRLVFYPG